MKSPDSLSRYSTLLKNEKNSSNRLHTYINRTQYYSVLLNRDYKAAIRLITSLSRDTLYKYDNIDRQNLADAFVNAGEPDSAKKIIDKLLADKAQYNHPEIKYHLYELLGVIASGKSDNQQAAFNYKMALEQAKDNVSKLIKVGDVSSRIKIDEIQNDYFQKDRLYRKERLLLISFLIVAVLAIAVVAMFYRNVKQKRHYEKLLFLAKKEELSYINSHDIRRHLTNILGIIDVIRHSDDKETEYFNLEPHLLYSAEKLDEAIKNISQKLDEDGIS
jgi:tetratricopeptide (TPR) repeat protein